jgi:hypothetical protein
LIVNDAPNAEACELRGEMERDNRVAGDNERPATKPRSYLFAVRLWREEAGGAEYRGNVRDAMGMRTKGPEPAKEWEAGAFRNFRDRSELAAFMCARIEENEQDERRRATLVERLEDGT